MAIEHRTPAHKVKPGDSIYVGPATYAPIRSVKESKHWDGLGHPLIHLQAENGYTYTLPYNLPLFVLVCE